MIPGTQGPECTCMIQAACENSCERCCLYIYVLYFSGLWFAPAINTVGTTGFTGAIYPQKLTVQNYPPNCGA